MWSCLLPWPASPHGLLEPSFESRGGDLSVINTEPQKMVTLSVIGDITHLNLSPKGKFVFDVTVVSSTRKGKKNIDKEGGTDITM